MAFLQLGRFRLGTAATQQQSILGVLLRAIYSHIKTLVQLLLSGGSIQGLGFRVWDLQRLLLLQGLLLQGLHRHSRPQRTCVSRSSRVIPESLRITPSARLT